MKKFAFIVATLMVLMGVLFLGNVKAQEYVGVVNLSAIEDIYRVDTMLGDLDLMKVRLDGYASVLKTFAGLDPYGYVFDYHDFKLTQDLYRFDDLVETAPFLISQNAYVFMGNGDLVHSVAGDETFYQIGSNKIVDILKQSDSFEDFTQKIRIDIVGFLIELGYKKFDIKPYIRAEANNAIMQDGSDFVVLKEIGQRDGLDVLLEEKLEFWKKDFDEILKFGTYLDYHTIDVSVKDYEHLGQLYMFKDEQDLRDLGYELISWRTRVNTDPVYRRHNISTAFANIGHVRMIMPGEVFSLREGFRYSRKNPGSKIFMDGYATVGNGVELVYGGGLCGVATAFYQGTLTNLGLDLLEFKPHSVYYRNLYEGELDGKYVSEPGLESTVYSPYYDVVTQNVRDYPIITVFNYDGLSGSIEQMFTLAKAQDKGVFEFVGKYKKGRLQCFTRNVNGEIRTSCYNSIKNF